MTFRPQKGKAPNGSNALKTQVATTQGIGFHFPIRRELTSITEIFEVLKDVALQPSTGASTMLPLNIHRTW